MHSYLESKSISKEQGCCLDPQKYVRKLLLLAPSASKLANKQKNLTSTRFKRLNDAIKNLIRMLV